MSEFQDFVGWTFVAAGVAFVLLASLGIFKLPDTLTRMAAGSKASTMGMLLAVTGAFIHSHSEGSRIYLVLGLIVIFLTAPVAAHALGRAALRAGLRVLPSTQGTEVIEKLRRQMAKDSVN